MLDKRSAGTSFVEAEEVTVGVSCDGVHLGLIALNLGDKVSHIFFSDSFMVTKSFSQVGFEFLFRED